MSEVVHGLLCSFSPSFPLDTSRRPKDSEREGQGYSFVSRGEMEADIRAGRYLEHGEYEGNLYGTRIDSIRGVVAAGKVCVLDVNPQVPPQPACSQPALWAFCCPPPRHSPCISSRWSPKQPPYNPSTTARSPTHLEHFSEPPRPPTPLTSASVPIPSHLPAVSPPFIPRTQVPGPQVPFPHHSQVSVPPAILPLLSRMSVGDRLPHPLLFPQAVKVLRTAEFVPYVVFIEAPDFETLRAMNRAALESGVSTKQLTVRALICGGRGLVAAWGRGQAGADEGKEVVSGRGERPTQGISEVGLVIPAV